MKYHNYSHLFWRRAVRVRQANAILIHFSLSCKHRLNHEVIAILMFLFCCYYSMVEEILNTRLMVKKAMKSYKGDKVSYF